MLPSYALSGGMPPLASGFNPQQQQQQLPAPFATSLPQFQQQPHELRHPQMLPTSVLHSTHMSAPIMAPFATPSDPGATGIDFLTAMPFDPLLLPNSATTNCDAYPTGSNSSGTLAGSALLSEAHGGSGNTGDRSNIFICRLPPSVDDAMLHSLFSPFGAIVSSVVLRDIFTGASRGIGFVAFATEASAAAAIANMNGLVIQSSTLSVQHARKYQCGKPSNRIFIRNIPRSTTEEQIAQLCKRFGHVTQVSTHADTARRNGDGAVDSGIASSSNNNCVIAFVTFGSKEAASTAAALLHNTTPFEGCGSVPLLTKVLPEVRRQSGGGDGGGTGSSSQASTLRNDPSLLPCQLPAPSTQASQLAFQGGSANSMPTVLQATSAPLPLFSQVWNPVPLSLPGPQMLLGATAQPPPALMSIHQGLQQRFSVDQQVPPFSPPFLNLPTANGGSNSTIFGGHFFVPGGTPASSGFVAAGPFHSSLAPVNQQMTQPFFLPQ